ncbi:hypothetical protein PG995_011584 [Apiospora arundinis]
MSLRVAIGLAICLVGFSSALPVTDQSDSKSIHPILANPDPSNQLWANKAPPRVVTVSGDTLTSLYRNVTAAPPSHPSSSPPTQQKRYTIGPDDRVRWDDRNYPYSAMGRLSNPKSLCSASLIGPRHVAAARHCWTPNVPYHFAPAFNGVEVLQGAEVTEILMLKDTDLPTGICSQNTDWAIFVLDRRLGEPMGFLGANTIDSAHVEKPLFYNYGYPGDRDGASRPYRQQSISVYNQLRCDANGPLDTDADASSGQSGGPLWLEEDGNYWQYGVMSTLTLPDGKQLKWTTFAGGRPWVDAIVYARERWP